MNLFNEISKKIGLIEKIQVYVAEVIEIREKYTDVGENEKFIKGDLFYLNKYDEFDSTLSILW